MNVISIPLDMIDAGDRLRAIDEDYAQLIAESFLAGGQRTPIEVRAPKKAGGRWRLISGGHRLEAARIACLDTVFAIELAVSDLQAQLLEVDENLIRHELTPLDRSTFLARRKDLWEQLHPQTTHGGARRGSSRQNGDLNGRFSAEVADKLGLSERSVQRAVSRFHSLAPEARQLISGTWLSRSGSQLDQLCKLPPTLQVKVARTVANDAALDDVRDVAAIVRQLQGIPDPTPTTVLEKFLGLWRRASASDRQHILNHLDAAMRREAEIP